MFQNIKAMKITCKNCGKDYSLTEFEGEKSFCPECNTPFLSEPSEETDISSPEELFGTLPEDKEPSLEDLEKRWGKGEEEVSEPSSDSKSEEEFGELDLTSLTQSREGEETKEAPSHPIGEKFREIELEERKEAQFEELLGEEEIKEASPRKEAPLELDMAKEKVDLVAPKGMIKEGVALRAPTKIHISSRYKVQKRRLIFKIAVLFLLLNLLGLGFFLHKTKYGIFGSNYIAERLPHPIDRKISKIYIKAGFGFLDYDTKRAYFYALREFQEARKYILDKEEAEGYLVYLYYLYQLRFGGEIKSLRHISEILLLDAKASKNKGSLILALAAKELVNLDILKAQQVLKRALLSKPKNGEALYLLGLSHLKANEIKEAEEVFMRFLRLKPNTPRGLFGLAQALLKKNNESIALEYLNRILKENPNHIGAILEKVKIMEKIGEDKKDVVAIIKQVISKKAGYISPKESASLHALLGKIYLNQNLIKKARKRFEFALKRESHNIEALLGMGTILYQEGNYRKALPRFEIAKAKDSNNILSNLGVAMCFIALDRGSEAKEILLNVLKAHPKDPQVLYWLGKAEEKIGNIKKAERYYRKAIEYKKDYLEPYLALNNLLFREDRTFEAINILKQVKVHIPSSPLISNAIGIAYLKRSELTSAEEAFKEALRADPGFIAARFNLGIVFRKRGKIEEAKEAFTKVKEINPEYPRLEYEQGLLLEAQDDLKGAIQVYESALKKNPKDTELLLRLGVVYFNIKEYKKAQSFLEEVLKERTDLPEAYYYLGRILVINKEYSGARRYFEKASSLDPQNAFYHFYLAQTNKHLGNIAEALKEVELAINILNIPDAYYLRGIIRLQQGIVSKALEDFQYSLALDKKNYKVYRFIGECYEQLRKTSKAIQYYEMALRYDQLIPEVDYKLGTIFMELGKVARAIIHLERAVKIESKSGSKAYWLPDAYYQLGVACKKERRLKCAIKAFEEYLVIAPSDAFDRDSAKQYLKTLISNMSP